MTELEEPSSSALTNGKTGAQSKATQQAGGKGEDEHLPVALWGVRPYPYCASSVLAQQAANEQ